MRTGGKQSARWPAGAASALALALALAVSAIPGIACGPAPRTEASALEDLQKDIDDFRANRTLPEERAEFVQRLAGKAVRAGLAINEQSAKRRLVGLHADEPLGLLILDVCFEELPAAPPEARLQLARAVLSEFPLTSAGALALDRELEALSSSPDAAIARCSELIAAGANPRQVRVALLRRMDLLSSGRQDVAAAIDAVRFWGLFAEDVRALHLQTRLLGKLDVAGLLLEKGMLSRAPDAGAVTRWLMSGLVSAHDGPGAALPPGLNECLQAYIKAAPSRSRFDCATGAAVESFEAAAMAARRALLDTDRSDGIDGYNAYAASLERALADSGGLTCESAGLLALVNMAVADRLAETARVWQYARSRLELKALPWGGKAGSLIESIGEKHLRLIGQMTDLAVRDGLPAERIAETFESNVAFLESRELTPAAIAAYEAFLERLPAFPKAPQYCLGLAESLCQNGSPAKGAEILLHLAATYPDSAEAPRASVRAGCLMLEAKQYESAYLQFSRALEAHPDSELCTSAHFGLALCEHALDRHELAEERLRTLLEQHPQNPLAPKTLLTLGMWELDLERYKEAAELFRSLPERYPNAPEVKASNNYLARLTEFMDGAGGRAGKVQ